MSHSKGPWIYDAESGEIHTKDRTGFWGPDHEPVVVATVEPLDGVNNGPLMAAAPDLLDALKTTLKNIMSLGPSGSLDGIPVPYQVWADVVSSALDKAREMQ